MLGASAHWTESSPISDRSRQQVVTGGSSGVAFNNSSADGVGANTGVENIIGTSQSFEESMTSPEAF